MRLLVILVSLATLLAIATPSRAAASAPATVTAHTSTYGTVLFDGRGFALYAFTRNPRGHSVCSGACAAAWPPYLVKSRPAAAAGVRASLLGTTRRPDGSLQATYAGRPLYFYVGDRKAGQILCQNISEFGGLWLVVKPDGKPVR